MRRFFSLLIVILLAAGLTMSTASAKRFGGGRSFGIQRSASSFSRAQSSPFSAASARSGNRWFGPLAGLVTGGLLASLFMGNGVGSGILSWLLVAFLASSVISLIRSRMRPNNAQSNYHGFMGNQARTAPYEATNQYAQHYAPQSNDIGRYPVGFDTDSFLRDAKVQFIRLQAAYDQKNLADLRKFTTPEVFGEIQLQLQERGTDGNQTEVVTLNAQLLDAMTDPHMVGGSELQALVASVKFSGLIREDSNQVAYCLQ